MLQPELRLHPSARPIRHPVAFDHQLASLLACGNGWKDCGGGLLRRSGYRQRLGNCRTHRVTDGRLRGCVCSGHRCLFARADGLPEPLHSPVRRESLELRRCRRGEGERLVRAYAVSTEICSFDLVQQQARVASEILVALLGGPEVHLRLSSYGSQTYECAWNCWARSMRARAWAECVVYTI